MFFRSYTWSGNDVFVFFICYFWISIVSAAVQKMYEMTLIMIDISVCHQLRASFTSITLMIWHKSSQNIGYSTSIQPLNPFGVEVLKICHRLFGRSSRFERPSFNEKRHVTCVFWIQITPLLFHWTPDRSTTKTSLESPIHELLVGIHLHCLTQVDVSIEVTAYDRNNFYSIALIIQL